MEGASDRMGRLVIQRLGMGRVRHPYARQLGGGLGKRHPGRGRVERFVEALGYVAAGIGDVPELGRAGVAGPVLGPRAGTESMAQRDALPRAARRLG